MTQVGCLEEWAKVEAAKATKAAKAAQEDSFDDAEAREPTPKPKRNVADVELKDILMEFDDDEIEQLADPANMFRSYRVYVHTPQSAPHKRRLEDDDLRFQLRLHGAVVPDTMDNITTHVIVPDDEDEFSHVKKENEYLHSSAMIEDRPVWVEKQIVHPAWVKESLAKKEVQDWLGYQVTTGSAQRATRRREAEAAEAEAAEARAEEEAEREGAAAEGTLRPYGRGQMQTQSPTQTQTQTQTQQVTQSQAAAKRSYGDEGNSPPAAKRQATSSFDSGSDDDLGGRMHVDDGYDDDAGVHQVLQFSSDDDEEDTQVRPTPPQLAAVSVSCRFAVC